MEQAAKGTTGGGQAVTAGPELTSVAITSATSPTNPSVGIVTYTFDENVEGRAAVANRFHVYRFDGTIFSAGNVRISGNTVIAEFPAGQLQNITTGTVDFGAVADVSGQQNPEGAAGVQSVTQAAGITSAPDLTSVGNFRSDIAGRLLVDYTFDEAVNCPIVTNPATGFELVLQDGTSQAGQTVTSVSTDKKVVTVQFTAAAVDVPQSQVARGTVATGTVSDVADADAAAGCQAPAGDADALNPLQAADVNNSGNTSEPDLVSAKALSSTQVEYTFDQPVSSAAAELTANPSRFRIYTADAVETGATSVTRSQTDARVVVATFGSVTQAVGANVLDNAVRSSQNEGQANSIGYNEQDEVALQQVGFESGKTTLPDLTAVKVIVDPVTQNRVVRYTFDQNVTGVAFQAGDFRLYDANNTQFTSTAAPTAVAGDNNSVDIAGGFTNSQVDAAVLGTVNDASADPTTQPLFPEGDANVTR